jgi:hypothetical protein
LDLKGVEFLVFLAFARVPHTTLVRIKCAYLDYDNVRDSEI